MRDVLGLRFALVAVMALIPSPLKSSAIHFTPDPHQALRASVYWSWEHDGLLLIADRSDLGHLRLPPTSEPIRLDPREVLSRHRRRVRDFGTVMVAQSRPEIAALAASWARHLGAALFLDGVGEEVLAGCRQIYVLGQVEIPEGTVPDGARLHRFADVEQIRAAYRQSWPTTGTAVLIEPADPYATVGVLVAQYYDAVLLTALDQALRESPTTLIVCASPRQFNDRQLLSLTRALEPRDGLGILTGLDRLACQLLWYRDLRYRELTRALPRVETVVQAANPAAHAAAAIRSFAPTESGGDRAFPLTGEEFRQALLSSAYLSFSGHGGPSYLRLSRRPDHRFETADVPAQLPPLLFVAGSCGTFRFWDHPESSLGLALTGSGAAAFIGFAYSPFEGFLPGQFDGAPAMAAHPGFPLGRVVRLLNHATELGFARVPYLFLLGDPHLAVLPQGPELLPQPGPARDERRFLLRRAGDRAGWVAFTIPARRPWGSLAVEQGGKVRHATSLPGKTFHRHLIATPREGALDVLALLPPGDVTLRLAAPRSLPVRIAGKGLRDADYALPFMTGSHGYGGFLFLAVTWLGLTILAFRWRLWRICRRHWGLLLSFALASGAAYLLFCHARWPHLTITTKNLHFDLASVAVPVVAATASLLTRLAVCRPVSSVLWASLAAGFPWWGAGVAMALTIGFSNLVMESRIGFALWNLGPAQPLLTTGLAVSVLALGGQNLLLYGKRRWSEDRLRVLAWRSSRAPGDQLLRIRHKRS